MDFVIVSAPAQSAIEIMENSAAKRVKVIHFYTAGFGETGGEEGKRLEEKVAGIARRSGVRVVGPNCMGVYSPQYGISWRLDFPMQKGGTVAFFSQSGWHATDSIKLGAARGFQFNKVVSYGNACDLNESDFLEYFTEDPETKIIVAYLEGVREGKRFLQLLRRVAPIKPVIVLKAGRSEAGARAIASHTGSLAGEEVVWDSLIRQAGAIRVYNLDELADTLLAFFYLPVAKQRGVAVIGSGGGPSVQSADDCASARLSVFPFPAEIRRKLHEFTPKAGTSVRNPIDFPFYWTSQELYQSIKIVAALREAHLLIAHISVDYLLTVPGGREKIGELSQAIMRAGKEIGKPLAMVLRQCGLLENYRVALEEQEKFIEAGVPVYPTIARAAQALNSMVQYYRFTDSFYRQGRIEVGTF